MNARAAVALLALALPARGQFVQPEGSRFHNGSTLLQQDDGRAGPLLQKLEAAAERGKTDEVISLLGALRALPGPELVSFGPRLSVPALERAARAITEPGREALAAKVEESEHAALGAAARDRDLPALLDRASRGVSLPTAREAAMLAARLLFEQGRFHEAAGLAARARGVAGADELAAAARRRLPPEPPAPPSVESGLQPQQAVALALPDTGADGQPFLASVAPGRLLLLDGSALYVLDRATRALAAPPLQPLDAFPGAAERLTAKPSPAPARFDAARAGDRWVFAYDPITQLGWAFDYATMPRTAFLVAADVGPTPRLAWTVEPSHGDEDSSAFGPPAIAGGRVFAQLFRAAATTDVLLQSFDLADGRLLWETPLVSAATVAPFETRFPSAIETPRAVEVAPVERDGVVWCCTGFGVVAAVDALSGSPLFLFRYDRLFPEDVGTFDPAFLWETGGWDDEPLRFWNDRVVVAPPDSRFLYMLATEPGPRGQLVLDDPIERLDRRHVIALEPDPQGSPSPALLCTRRGLGGEGLVRLGPDGHVLELGARLPTAGRLTGRPLQIGERVLVPTTAGLLDLSARDLSAPPRTVPLKPGVPNAIEAVYALDAGVATLSPPVQTADSARWIVQWLQPAP